MATTLAVPQKAEIERPGDLAERARQFAVASRADATLDAYESDWQHFTTWGERHGHLLLPADPETVALYITDLAAEFKPSTVSRRLSAISVMHQHAGHPSPTQHAVVRSVMSGIRRTIGVAPKHVAPATIGEVRKMVARLDGSTLDIRDRAILLLGFAGAFRRSELVALNIDDLADTADGLLVTIRRSKADQEGRGDTKAIPFGSDPETCPVAAIKRWIEVAGIEDGALLRGVDRHGNVGGARLSGKGIAIVVKRAAERVGLDPTAYSGHSLRAGFVTTAAANGASERAIARQTGHAAGSTVLRTYMRHASAFTENAVSTLGL